MWDIAHYFLTYLIKFEKLGVLVRKKLGMLGNRGNIIATDLNYTI